ncbi:unnamed protein product, partial [Iphiclides podalirius]
MVRPSTKSVRYREYTQTFQPTILRGENIENSKANSARRAPQCRTPALKFRAICRGDVIWDSFVRWMPGAGEGRRYVAGAGGRGRVGGGGRSTTAARDGLSPLHDVTRLKMDSPHVINFHKYNLDPIRIFLSDTNISVVESEDGTRQNDSLEILSE